MKKVLVALKDDNFFSEDLSEYVEYLFPVFGFSRSPVFFFDELLPYLEKVKKKGLRCVLEWDLLLTETKFEETLNLSFFKWIISLFHSVRIQDLGAFEYLKKNYPELPLQLILEHGNHNFESLQNFEKSSSRLERLILSSQIPLQILKSYIEKLNVPVEILFQGPLLLSQTPRRLLSRLNLTEAFVTSLEGNKNELWAKEEQSGTILFHRMQFHLRSHIQELSSWEKTYFRFDFRFNDRFQGETTGFFEKNKSSEIFVHLKNSLIERHDKNYIGEVVDVLRDKYIGIHLGHPKQILKAGDFLLFLTPEGKRRECKVSVLYNFLLEEQEFASGEDVIFLPYLSTVSVRSSVYFLHDQSL